MISAVISYWKRTFGDPGGKPLYLQRKIIILVSLSAAIAILTIAFTKAPAIIPLYNKVIFYPGQWVRGLLFGWLPFSLGDLVYIVAGACLLLTVVKWIRCLIRFRTLRSHLLASFLRTANVVLAVYTTFLLGWGGNYYKHPLRESWGIVPHDTVTVGISKDTLRARRIAELTSFDSFLVTNINTYVAGYASLPGDRINNLARAYYGRYTDSRLAHFGLGIKSSFFGYFLERSAVEGYYNPFTGEGQIDNGLPAFAKPFLVVHEMAHQAGIAAEGDANLLAYALCTATDDSTFRYSAYLELWLYANNRLYARDSTAAKRLEARLNKLTAEHIDTLEELSEKYHNDFARYSSQVFDSYLKMQRQQEGIKSYGNVTTSAWLLEQRRKSRPREVIRIP